MRALSFYTLFVFVAGVLLAACGAQRDTALVQTDEQLMKATSQGDFAKAVAEGDGHWEKRFDRGSLEKALETWEKAATVETPDLSEEERRQSLYDLHVKLAHGYYLLSDGHVRFDDVDEDVRDERMMNTYNQGVTAAEKALAIYSPAFAKEIRYEKSMLDAIQALDKGAAPALYWYATCMGKWALLEGFATILARKDNIKAVMDKVEADGPTYFYGASYRYFGVYYTKLPFPGGDLQKSKEYFEKAVNAAPNYLATRTLMAKHWATKAERKDLFTEQLEFIIKFDTSKAPEIEAENKIEQKKAQRLLDKAEELF